MLFYACYNNFLNILRGYMWLCSLAMCFGADVNRIHSQL